MLVNLLVGFYRYIVEILELYFHNNSTTTVEIIKALIANDITALEYFSSNHK